MPNQNPRESRTSALLIVDMINDFRFESGDRLFENALPAAKAIASLKESSSVPFIFVNDNFKKWHDSFASTIESVEKSSEQGREIVSVLRPRKDDYYILKPHRSGFYKTPLRLLLESIGVTDLIITGVTTDICVLITASDAQMRGFRVRVPRNCCAAVRDEYHEQALDLLARNADADTTEMIGESASGARSR